jgi:hypothetical protein
MPAVPEALAEPFPAGRLDSQPRGQVGFSGLPGGASVLVNGAVFKTVCEPVRAGLGRFDSYTPPPKSSRQLAEGRWQKAVGRRQAVSRRQKAVGQKAAGGKLE